MRKKSLKWKTFFEVEIESSQFVFKGLELMKVSIICYLRNTIFIYVLVRSPNETHMGERTWELWNPEVFQIWTGMFWKSLWRTKQTQLFSEDVQRALTSGKCWLISVRSRSLANAVADTPQDHTGIWVLIISVAIAHLVTGYCYCSHCWLLIKSGEKDVAYNLRKGKNTGKNIYEV